MLFRSEGWCGAGDGWCGAGEGGAVLVRLVRCWCGWCGAGVGGVVLDAGEGGAESVAAGAAVEYGGNADRE